MSRSPEKKRSLVAGIGSPHGDDQAGWLVIDRLEEMEHFSFESKKLSAPAELLDRIQGLDCLICLDAVEGGESPGCIQRYVWPFEASWQLRTQTTHGLDLVSVLNVAESVGFLPRKTILLTIQGINWASGAETSPPVKNKLAQLARCVKQETVVSRKSMGSQ